MRDRETCVASGPMPLTTEKRKGKEVERKGVLYGNSLAAKTGGADCADLAVLQGERGASDLPRRGKRGRIFSKREERKETLVGPRLQRSPGPAGVQGKGRHGESPHPLGLLGETERCDCTIRDKE